MRHHASEMVKVLSWKLLAREAECHSHKAGCSAALTALLVLFVASFLAPTAFAATFTVTSLADAGPNTLRQAILDAALNTEADVIEFELDAPIVGVTIVLAQSLNVINDDITIDGSSEPGVLTGNGLTIPRVTVSGNGVGRVFFVDPTSTLELVELNISDGDATSETTNKGGGIYNTGTLFVTTSNITNNTANIGGGIANDNGTVTITHTTLANNTAATEPASFGVRGGGAVANDSGEVVIDSSTLRDNTASSSSILIPDAFGGGIMNISSIGPTGTVKMYNTTVSGNEAGDDAGAFYNQHSDNITIVTSTITGNLAASAGGAIENFGTVEVQSTILAGNTSGVSDGNSSHDCRSLAGVITSNGHNLVGPTCAFSNPTDLTLGEGPLVGLTISGVIDTNLDANGGPTLTHALLGTSPAIDTGSCVGIAGNTIENDQRSMDRPFDDPAILGILGGDACDIGAFELDGTSCVSRTKGNWKDSTTWSCGFKPTLANNTVIAPGHEVQTLDDQAAKKLKIADGKGRGTPGGGKLSTGQKFIDIHGDLIIDGKLDPGTGKIDMKGSGKQKIKGKGKKKFHMLHVSNEASTPGDSDDVEAEGPIEVSEEMSVKKGQFRPDDLSIFKNLLIDSPGILKPKLEALLEITGDMKKFGSGSFTHNKSTVKFRGKKKQKISGGLKFDKVEVDKTTLDDDLEDLELGTGTEVEGETKVVKGKLTPDNLTKFQNLTIESSGKLKPTLAASKLRKSRASS